MIKPWMLVLGWALLLAVTCTVLMYYVGLDNWTGWQGTTLQVLTFGLAPYILFAALLVGGSLDAAGAIEVTSAVLFFALGMLQAAIVWAIVQLVRRLQRGRQGHV